jgi:hypothetical protein
MTDCGGLSERIPEVAAGRSEWTPEEVQHLNGCRMCQQEWQLVRAARRLGDHMGATFDSPALAASVLLRLQGAQEAGRLRRSAWSFTGLAAAAAIAAAVWTGGFEGALTRPADSSPGVATGLAIPLPELESLQPAELDSVLQTMDESSISGVPVDEPGLSDLNPDELKSVLDSWEG